MSAKHAYSLKATYDGWGAVEHTLSSLPIDLAQAARRKDALAELKAKSQRENEKAPRQALLEEIRGRSERSVSTAEQDLDEWVMVCHRWDCRAPNGAPLARHWMQ